MSTTQQHPAAFDFQAASARAAGDQRLKLAIGNAVMRQYLERQNRWRELPDVQALRDLAARIKQHTIDHLDYYLEQLIANVEKNGGHVHIAHTAADARRIVLDIAAKAKCRGVIKSKSMVSEEVELTPALEEAGLDVVETDLGEFILQIAHDKPSHIVGPCIHKDKASIAKLFSEYFHIPYNDDPTFLTQQARRYLRDKFRRADLGMTGGNFLIAETGQVCIVENEGNGRQSTTSPRVLVSLVGIEKVIPRMIDLSVMLKLLARSSTGQHFTVYTSIFGSPRKPGEKSGPEEFHLVLLDNGRTDILAGEYRETLRCIRCGACLNACPVFRKIGGHAYGHIYSGPIGALITPLMQGLDHYKELPYASSLCGACAEVCPVKIDIPQHLIRLRRDIVSQRLTGRFERFVYRAWARLLQSRFLYGIMGSIQRRKLRRRAQDGWVGKLPSVAAPWTNVRDLPAPAKKSFHQLWKKRPSKR